MSGHPTRNVFERYNIISEDDLLCAIQRGHDLNLRPSGYEGRVG
jgi:hypothetical protein